MIDIKHILSLSPGKRDLEIRKLLNPGPWKHDWHWNLEGENVCRRCLFPLEAYEELARDKKYFQPCVPDQIALDWELAMKERDECQHMEFNIAMHKVLNRVVEIEKYPCGIDYGVWVTTKAQPHHYLLAAIVAKESK